MTDESQDQPVLSTADRTLLKSAAAPTEAQLEATRRALRTRIAALAAGAAIAQAASSAEATGAATTAAMSSTATAAATATAAPGLVAIAAAKWISAGLIVTAVAGGTVMATRQSRSLERPHTAASVAAPALLPVAPPAVVTAQPAPVAAARAPNEAPLQAGKTLAPRPKPTRRAVAAANPARALEGETLSAELALLHDARQALAGGDAAAALQALDGHAARFPKAVLRQEALSARALALCATGRTAEAHRAAAQLARIAPRSPHLIRLADSCALEDVDPSE
jgi:hypothetical protein